MAALLFILVHAAVLSDTAASAPSCGGVENIGETPFNVTSISSMRHCNLPNGGNIGGSSTNCPFQTAKPMVSDGEYDLEFAA